MFKIAIICGLLLCSFFQISCKKFLETKSDQTLSTPDNLDELQSMLNNPSITNLAANFINSSTDEYYVNYTDWLAAADANKKPYVWDAQIDYPLDWTSTYKSVFIANTVLFNLDRINEPGQENREKEIKGSSLFLRAYIFYHLAQAYALQYDPATADKDMGIVLRLGVDFNEQSIRSSVQQTYDQIVKDLEIAVGLLPAVTFYKVHPSKAAAYGLLARVYLQMGNYGKAKENADACLSLSGELINYNTLVASSAFPLGDYTKNPEIIFYSTVSNAYSNTGTAKIDSTLYPLYEANDLRKTVFFRQNTDKKAYDFKGNYTGDGTLFNGIAVDEIYLIRAECNARLGKVPEAMADLNTLLRTRWNPNASAPSKAYLDKTASNVDGALSLILSERRKELVYRGLRWSDLKRLNKEPKYAITLKRVLNGITYELAPNDLRYACYIPLSILTLTTLKQNPR